jgi:hypothetical protein
MARIRSDKPEAYQSETLAEVSLAAERTFKGMATIADDRGRLADKPAQVNGELWSMRGNHSRDDLEAELGEMVKVDLVCRYTGCDGKGYLHLVRWDSHQKIDRPSKSRLPRCPHHQLAPDYCGRHEGDCPTRETSPHPAEPSTDTREDSRGLDADSRGIGDDSMQDLGSRTEDLGSLDLGSIPATPDADKPRRRSKAEDPQRAKHAGDVVAAFVDGAVGSGQPEPAQNLRARVGRDARQLLAEGYDAETLIKAAHTMGAGEWHDLAVQVRKDAAASGHGPKRGHQPYRNPADDSAYEGTL